MSVLDSAAMYARFALGLRRYFRQDLTLAQAEAQVCERMQLRDENFLRLIERAVYGYAASPYLALLRRAGCESGDLRNGVRREGLEATLQKLRAAGVVVSFEQFKGRAPLECDGRIVAADASAFDNPFLAHAFVSESGGSSGKGTRIAHDLEHQAATASHHLLARAAHGVLDAPFALWRGILPDGSGINNILHTTPFHRAPERWFSHLDWRGTNFPLQSLFFSYSFPVIGRLSGAAIPFPEYTPMDRADVVAQWVYDTVQRRGSALLGTQVSRALRVALAAQKMGLDLTGAVMMIAGEPPTPAKVQAIVASGARVFPTYGMAEVGRMAMGCGEPLDTNDTHFLHDAFALITHDTAVPNFDVTIPAFHLTTLLPTTPKLMLNVSGDDYGVVEERRCGCLFDSYGYHTHLREIRSVNKLTGEGTTLVGNDLVSILENTLPARFGGSSLDYQFQEFEDAAGFTRLKLVISPRVVLADSEQVIPVLLNAMSAASQNGHVTRLILQAADSLQVERAEPIWTARGKFMPLHLVKAKRSPHMEDPSNPS